MSARRRGGGRKRRGTFSPQARETRRQQEAAERRKLTPRLYALRRVVGCGLIGLAVLVGASHWMKHLGVFTILPHGWADQLIGYPAAGAGALGVAGAVVLSM